MSTYNSILAKTQSTLKTYLDSCSLSFSPTVLHGISATAKTLPAVICECATAEHEQVGFATGNWIATAEIRLRENADDTTEAQHLSHAGELFDVIVTDGLAADLTTAAAGDLTVSVFVPQTMSYSIVDRSWESVLQIKLVVKGS